MLALAACGGASSSAGSSPAPTSAQQAASIVAGHHSALSAAIAYEASCTSFDCLAAVALTRRWDKIASEAGALNRDLRARMPYDPEVRGLVDETVAGTASVTQTSEAFDSCWMVNHTLDKCAAEQGRAESAFRALPALLDRWKPYGG